MEVGKTRVLFLCVYNSARSQMAEGLLRGLHGDEYEVFSAGAHPAGVNPWAIKAMAELHMDISKHHSKSVDEFSGTRMDYVVTVCAAGQACPTFAGRAERLHWEIEDPGATPGPEMMEKFRKARDEMRRRIEETFGASGPDKEGSE